MAAVQEQRGEQATGAEARAGSPSLLDRVKQAVGLGGTEEAGEAGSRGTTGERGGGAASATVQTAH